MNNVCSQKNKKTKQNKNEQKKKENVNMSKRKPRFLKTRFIFIIGPVVQGPANLCNVQDK